jgi:hypothetical protein
MGNPPRRFSPLKTEYPATPIASRNASTLTVPSCTTDTLPTLTSAETIPATPVNDVRTAVTQCWQLIPLTRNSVIMRES